MPNHNREFLVQSVFRLSDGSGGDHHYILVSDPKHESGNCVIVNWTTYRKLKGDDTSCILDRTDHGAITRESLVNYRGARLARASEVYKLIKAGTFDICDTLLKEDAYRRVMLGFATTTRASTEVVNFLENEGFLPCPDAPNCWSSSREVSPVTDCAFRSCPAASA